MYECTYIVKRFKLRAVKYIIDYDYRRVLTENIYNRRVKNIFSRKAIVKRGTLNRAVHVIPRV